MVAQAAGDAKILEVLADENASLQAANRKFRKKLIETYEAERQEISNAVNPT